MTVIWINVYCFSEKEFIQMDAWIVGQKLPHQVGKVFIQIPVSTI